MSEEQTPSITMKVKAREGSVIKNVTQIIGSRYPSLKDFVYKFKERIEEHTERFVGREFIFQELDKFRENHSCGYFRIIAEAGLGKTAIAVAMSNQYDAPIFFVNASEGLISPSDCLQHLCAVLIARYELKHTHLPKRSGNNANFLSQLLGEATEKEAKKEKPGPIWVVVDALDEAESPPGSNILLLPGQLPDGVYFLLTHRPGSYNIQLTGNTRSVDYELRGDSLEQQRDIESFLQTQANSPEIRQAIDKAQISSERFVAALKETSQGNFMYLTYVLRDIGQQESGFNSLNLNQLPQGLEAYYEFFWQRMKGAVQEKDWDLCEQVLERLATAGEPITEQWLADHTQKRALDIRNKVLVPWRRFLSQGNQREKKTWQIIHISFTNFLKEKLDLEAGHRAIANYYADPTHWQSHNGYPFRHKSTHLRQTGNHDRLFALVENADWYQAQQQYDVSSNNYFNDVNEAWLAAETINEQAAKNNKPVPLFVQEIRCVLLTSSLNSRSTNIPPELLVRLLEENKWTPNQALATIRQNADESNKALSIELITPFLKSDKYLKKQALEIVQAIRNESIRTEALTGSAPQLFPQSEQELDKLLREARKIKDKYHRVQKLTELSPHLSPQLKHEVLAEALSTTREIVDPSLLNQALTNYVQALIELAPRLSGQQKQEVLDKALKETQKISAPSARVQALTRLVPLLSDQQLRHEVLDKALRDAQMISNQFDSAQALARLIPLLSDQQLRHEVLDKALNITRKISDQSAHVKTLRALDSHLSPQQLTRAVSTTWEIAQSPRFRVLREKASVVSKYPIPDLYPEWKNMLRRLAMLKRESLLSDLVALVPMIVSLGGDEAVREMAQAIQDVGKLFP